MSAKGRGKSKKAKAQLSWRGRGLERAPLVLSATFAGAALLGLLERWVWIGVVVREWAVLLACVLSFLVLASAIARAKLPTLLATIGLVVCAWPSARLLMPSRPVPAGGPVLRVAVVSTEASTPSARLLSELSRNERLDLLALDAPVGSGKWPKLSELVRSQWSGRHEGRALAGRALYVAPPLASTARAHAGGPVTLRVGACQLQVAQVSLPSVLALASAVARKEAIASLPELGKRGVLLGHFGGRPDAPDLRDKLSTLGVRDSRAGFGVLASTPGALGPFGRAVDHILVHGWLSVRERRTAPPLVPGDHRIALAAIELTEPSCRPRK